MPKALKTQDTGTGTGCGLQTISMSHVISPVLLLKECRVSKRSGDHIEVQHNNEKKTCGVERCFYKVDRVLVTGSEASGLKYQLCNNSLFIEL